MQKSDDAQMAQPMKRKVRISTTLDRRYVGQPGSAAKKTVGAKKNSMIQHFNNVCSGSTTTVKKAAADQPVEPVAAHPMQERANAKMRSMRAIADGQQIQKESAKKLKDKAIRKALAEVTMSEMEVEKEANAKKLHFGFGRVMLALVCATIAVITIVYFMNLNMPDVSMRVAAMQTGINASYPGYVPRDYSLASITSEDKKITLDFRNNAENQKFSLVEEASSWDSNALLNNFVKDAYSENYTIIREQGLTIYVDHSNATWVNGGILYKINASGDTLTNKQIKSIAVSL